MTQHATTAIKADAWKGTREYGTVEQSEISRETTLETAEGYWLSHTTAGWKPAGSCMIHTNEEYGVFFMCDGAQNGRRFKASNYVAAVDLYNKWVSKRAGERGI